SGSVTSAVSGPTIGSGRFGFAMSHNGRLLRIGGSAEKFLCGGGGGVGHPGGHPSPGVSPANFPRENHTARFQTRISAAALIKKTPTVETMFIQPQLGRSG